MSKGKPISMLTRLLLDINKNFKMRYCISFSLNCLQNYQKLNLRLPNLLNKGKIFCNYQGWLLAVLIPHERKLYRVPHANFLISRSEPSILMMYGSTFRHHYTLLKNNYFSSYNVICIIWYTPYCTLGDPCNSLSK